MLLYQMKQLNELDELHVPDRCEGVLNDTWQGLSHLRAIETDQDKITKFWKAQTQEDVQKYLNVTAGVSEYLYFLTGQTTRPYMFWELCSKVDQGKARSLLTRAWEQKHGTLQDNFDNDMFYRLTSDDQRTILRDFIESCDVRQNETLFGLKHMFFILELVPNTEPDEFYTICYEVNKEHATEMKNENKHRWTDKKKFSNVREENQERLQRFVLDSTPDEIQKFFDKMIVTMKWRNYILKWWQKWMFPSKQEKNHYFGVDIR